MWRALSLNPASSSVRATCQEEIWPLWEDFQRNLYSSNCAQLWHTQPASIGLTRVTHGDGTPHRCYTSPLLCVENGWEYWRRNNWWSLLCGKNDTDIYAELLWSLNKPEIPTGSEEDAVGIQKPPSYYSKYYIASKFQADIYCATACELCILLSGRKVKMRYQTWCPITFCVLCPSR